MSTLRNAAEAVHVVTNGTNVLTIRLPDVYSDIGSVVGVTKLTGERPAGANTATEGGAKRDGKILSIRIRYQIGTAKAKTANIIASLANASGAIQDLPNKSFNGGTILSAYFPRRRRLT